MLCDLDDLDHDLVRCDLDGDMYDAIYVDDLDCDTVRCDLHHPDRDLVR